MTSQALFLSPDEVIFAAPAAVTLRLYAYGRSSGESRMGTGEMGMSFGHKDAHDPPYPPEMIEAQAKVKAACDAADIAFLTGSGPVAYSLPISESQTG